MTPDSPTSPSAAASDQRGGGSPDTGLTFRPASSLQEVVEAWTLVYRSYLRSGLVRTNRWKLHTVPHAIQSHSVVICGHIQGLAVSTLSAYFDQRGGMGLPADEIYPNEVRALRDEGRRLMEIGLFADRREHIQRSVEALLELMRHVCYFGANFGATDGLIRVQPRHAPFYTRLLGFDQIGAEKPHPTVEGRATVLLHLDGYAKIEGDDLPRGLRHFKRSPLGAEAFAGRYVLDGRGIAGSPIEHYLQHTPEAAVSTG